MKGIVEITAENAKKDPEVVLIEKIGANEKIWEAVILDNDGKQKTVMLTKDELAEVDADKVVILNYIGKLPEPWWWRQYRNPLGARSRGRYGTPPPTFSKMRK